MLWNWTNFCILDQDDFTKEHILEMLNDLNERLNNISSKEVNNDI